jgi:hypothetical protein
MQLDEGIGQHHRPIDAMRRYWCDCKREDTMRAYRLLQAQAQPEFQEVPEPHAGPGQGVVKVAGAHSRSPAMIGQQERAVP